MPKKQPKNGYFYFMLDFKRRAERHGNSFRGGMQEVAAAASNDWKYLPQSRKEYFNHLAKEKRNDPRPNLPRKDERRFNCQGVSVAEIKMQKAKAEDRLKQQNDFIAQFVNQMNLNDLRDKLIYVIHVNIFCKTDNAVYYPAEIGIVKFSLRGGVKGVFHRYIDPGEIAPGYSFEVKDHSERTHRLTLPFVRSVDGTSDFKRLYGEICEFLSDDEVKNGILPPLFTMYDDVFFNSSLNAVKGTFKNLWSHVHRLNDQDDDSWECMFKVLPLPDMFYQLKNRCMAVSNPNTIAFPNVVLAKAQLQKDTYHYELDTACKFHRDEDIISHCSQSFVLRWVYIIRDHCADLIGVDLFPKYIVPKTEIKNEKEDFFEDDLSIADSQYSSEFSYASVDFPKTGLRVKHEMKDSSLPSGIKRENDIEPHLSVRTAKRERDADEYDATKSEKRDKNDDVYSVPHSSSQNVAISFMKKDENSGDVLFAGYKNHEDNNSTFVKTEKDSDAHPVGGFMTQENDVASCSVAGSLKQEKDVASCLTVGSIKQEKDVASCSTVVSIEPEKDVAPCFTVGSIKQEKDETLCSTVGSIKQEKDVTSCSTVEPIKQEKDIDSHSTVSAIKQERDVDSIKVEKNVELIKLEKDVDSIKMEKGIDAIKGERDADLIKLEKDAEPDLVNDRIKVEKVDPGYAH